jgi:UDP-N-acetylglucosamine--N-acetylmuramyl-(pentapeptide) pyrophosphoryl-undecaprenol N-acetylglucosamine transferase
MTGGGSGGHITPILAVAAELKKLQPDTRIVYIGQKGDALGDIPAKHPAIDAVYAVQAGKFRRYHGEGFKQLLDVPTMLKNLRDAFRVISGTFQSRKLLKTISPDVIFVKGGFVGVPVGLAAANLHIPFVTHDSDAIPGLANRIIARWASMHAVALPKEVYAYPADKTVTVGVPVASSFKLVNAAQKEAFRRELGMAPEAKLLFIIGGGLGAQRVNLAVAEAMPHLLHEFRDLQVVHGVGRANEETIQKLYTTALSSAEQGRVVVKGYFDNVYLYSGAADVIITRAGATNLAEFAVQGKPCIVVPNPLLTGGHQLENARYLEEKHAAVVVTEYELQENPNVLAARVSALLKDDARCKELAANLSTFAEPDAAKKLAQVLISQTQTRASNETAQT